MSRFAMLETQTMGSPEPEALAAEPGAAFARLVEIHLDGAYRLATFILAGDRSEAEDAVHDAAVRAWRHFGGLRDPGLFEPWFTRIVVNCCRDRLHTRRLRPLTLPDGSSSTEPDVADALARSDALAGAMRTLPPEHRVVIGLRYLSGYSIDEIAARTGARTGTVKSRLHYALRSLHASLDAAGRDGSGR